MYKETIETSIDYYGQKLALGNTANLFNNSCMYQVTRINHITQKATWNLIN